MGDDRELLAATVATALVGLDFREALAYREVTLEVTAVDSPPGPACALAVEFHRVFFVQASHWPALALSQRHRRPESWESEVITCYRRREGLTSLRLQEFEAEYALRAFLSRIEHDIDSVFARAEECGASWRRGWDSNPRGT
jgi:hypothetical protein